MITRAHQSGLQVHAYVNMLPTWLCNVGAPPATTPEHLFWTLSHSTTWSAWRVHSAPDTPQSIATCSDYLWASPALSLTRDHITAVAADIVNRYDVDGLHIDLIRYPGSGYSYDPFTMAAFSEALQITPSLTITSWRPAFQRAQINTLVSQIYSAVIALKPNLLVSAAVWPNYSDGYNGFYQASKDWLAGWLHGREYAHALHQRHRQQSISMDQPHARLHRRRAWPLADSRDWALASLVTQDGVHSTEYAIASRRPAR